MISFTQITESDFNVYIIEFIIKALLSHRTETETETEFWDSAAIIVCVYFN